MIRYCIRKILFMIPVFLGIVTVSFFVTELAPGDPVEMQMQMNPKISQESKARILEIYGYNKPITRRYLDWTAGMLRFDFGNSIRDGQPVLRKIASRIPVTLLINSVSMIILLSIAIPLGIFCAVRHGTLIERVIDFLLMVGFSVPTFWLALLLMTLFGVHWHLLPISGISSLDSEYLPWIAQATDVALHLTLPVLATTLTGLAGISKFMRNSMLEVLHQDYIRTARSFGIGERKVLLHYALRNSLLPIVTILGLSVPGLLGGSVIFETIFSIPGIGKMMYDSVMTRDFPVYMSMLVIGALLTLIGNFLADVSYRLIDPRIGWDD